MKLKTILLFIIAIIIILNVKDKSDNIIIPSNAIRIRVIANSNSQKDIENKIKVSKSVEKELYSLLKGVNDVNEARRIIKNNMQKLHIDFNDYEIKYGLNHFPIKNYKGVIYPEGDYESLVITLGEGVGNNWWCVLFPPLCLLEGNENTSDVEYKLYVKELIDKYF